MGTIFRFIRILLTLIFGAIYWPINALHLKVQKWYFSMKTKDIVVWYAFTPFYWIEVIIVFIVSIPYEFLIAVDLH
jgi:hypothetical protein